MFPEYRYVVGKHAQQPALHALQIIKRVGPPARTSAAKPHWSIIRLGRSLERRDFRCPLEQIGRGHCQNLHQLLFSACFCAPPPGR